MGEQQDTQRQSDAPTSATTTDLSQLPDNDAAALKRIQDALWATEETRGAAVMVGAGLTRTARRAAQNAPLPPLWRDIAAEMKRHLYPNDQTTNNQSNTPQQDPLRLAQEYEAVLGRDQLDRLIRNAINDETLTPGPLHTALVRLPWTDILTTNWDTLIERAAKDYPQGRYETVLNKHDIPRTRAPRIIKLNGTLPSSGPFIITEEDFRTYPQQFAPFVNLTQQILMENALCLIGFSGDDPNFLQWTGWVRDNLGRHAPRIYLVGALRYSQARRKTLEARNVSLIDFTPLLDTELDRGQQHEQAVTLFLKALKDAKPWPSQNWPSKPPNEPREPNEPTLEGWRATRHDYPGWVFAPEPARTLIRIKTQQQDDIKRLLDTTNPEEQHELLYELAWRLEITLQPLPEHLREQLATATEAPTLNREQRADMACWLLRDAREREDNQAFAKWHRWIETNADNRAPDLNWERCLHARDTLNYAELERLLPRITGDDPIWGLRRAALLTELGKDEQAINTAQHSLKQLKKRKAQDPRSIWIASRLAWALFVCGMPPTLPSGNEPDATEEEDHAAGTWEPDLAALNCDPWEERRAITDELQAAVERKNQRPEEERPAFDPGYARRWKRHDPPFPETALTRALRFLDQAGIPRSIGHMLVANDILEQAIDLEDVDTPIKILRLIRTGATNDLLDKHLSRLAVARLPEQHITETINTLRTALTEALSRAEAAAHGNQRNHWLSRATRTAEVLSRLIIRADPTTIEETLTPAFATAQTATHRWLIKGLYHLLTRGLQALAHDRRAAFVLTALELPLPGEHANHTLPDDDLFDEHGPLNIPALEVSRDDVRWERRINDLTEAVAAKDFDTREQAIWRLLRLHQWNVLTTAEQEAFATSLWARRTEPDGLPASRIFLSHIYLFLPEPTPGLARTIFEQKVILLPNPHQPMADDLDAVLNAARHIPEDIRYLLSREHAQQWLERTTVKIRAFTSPTEEPRQYAEREEKRFLRSAGRVLGGAILPRLDPSDVTDRDITLILDTDAPGLVEALPALVSLKPELRERAANRLRRALAGSESTQKHAMRAVLEWTCHDRDDSSAIPEDLIGEIARMVTVRIPRTLPLALDAAKMLVSNRRFTEDDLARLDIGLTYLLGELDYAGDRIAEIVTYNQLRAQCVSLAATLKAAGHESCIVNDWLAAAENDPLPDVRQAALETR